MGNAEQQRAARAASAAARQQRAADQAQKVALRRAADAARKQQAEIRKQRDELRKIQSVLKNSEQTLRQSARAGAASVVTGRYAGRLPSNVHRVATRRTVSTSAAMKAASDQVAKELRRSMNEEQQIRKRLRDEK